MLKTLFAFSLANLLGACGATYMGGGGPYMGGGYAYGLSPMGMTPVGMGMGGYGMGMGGSGMINPGTEYGSGGMELGTNLGGWGDGIGKAQPQVPMGQGTLDNDPHALSSSDYQNPDFVNPRDTPNFYHPSQNGSTNP